MYYNRPFRLQVERNAKYYVVSVLAVMLGISSLVFTVFSIEVDSNGRGFDDQGAKGVFFSRREVD